jgi:hypothetical protein
MKKHSLYHLPHSVMISNNIDLDATSLCRSLVELQEVLDQHRVSDAAECIERGKLES